MKQATFRKKTSKTWKIPEENNSYMKRTRQAYRNKNRFSRIPTKDHREIYMIGYKDKTDMYIECTLRMVIF